VIDCSSNVYLRELPDHPGVAGVLIDSEQDLLLTSDRGCARISAYRCSDESLLGRVDVGPRPNGIAYDAGRRNAFAFDLGEPIGANCSASVVSLDEMTVIATIPLPGRPRWAVYDAERNLVYANIREPAQIIVIDAGSLRIVAAFDVPSVGPHGLALVDDRLFSAADAGKLVALHRDDGHMIGSADLPAVCSGGRPGRSRRIRRRHAARHRNRGDRKAGAHHLLERCQQDDLRVSSGDEPRHDIGRVAK